MTDDDLAARYETLRAAAAEVLHSALNTRHPAPYTAELHELHRVLLDSPSAPAGTPDPARHSLAFTDYREDGSSGPYELTRLTEEIRAELADDRARGEHVPDHPVRDVPLTQLRALVIGSLLHELAARLAPGPAVGVAEAGRELAEIAADLGTRLINQTSAGAQQ
ncbi:hypothetical protein EV193_10327 [Herbihabitans rhizosphaerae]|uniref:Uncharacterized protein n=1 Tax=Herbihabitans rhizosphaerae TaxID=1872711 RepID=A0A4Q7KVX4_9PSEU|nr:hypothetical protein [Herbihabitans rhizosphaerae]RZS40716.1 hypothetical protein EV193_10327 [Herbihabitans rhizosphaerae]